MYMYRLQPHTDCVSITTHGHLSASESGRLFTAKTAIKLVYLWREEIGETLEGDDTLFQFHW